MFSINNVISAHEKHVICILLKCIKNIKIIVYKKNTVFKCVSDKDDVLIKCLVLYSERRIKSDNIFV